MGLIQDAEQGLTSLGGALSAALNPIAGIEGDIKSVADATAETDKVIEETAAVNNTPQMQANVEAQRIEADKQRIEADIAKNDLALDQEDAGR